MIFRIFLISLFLVPAYGKEMQCWVVDLKNQDGNLHIDCRIGSSPYRRLCPALNKNYFGNDYKIEVVTPRTILPDLRTDWTEGYILQGDEYIECSIDAAKKQARIDAIAAKIASDEAAKTTKQNAWVAACASAKPASVEQLLCQERGL